MLIRKLLRDLWRQGWLTWAQVVVTALGVALFVASAASFRNLERSYRETQEDLALADLHVAVRGAGPEDVARIEAIPGVDLATVQHVADIPLTVDRGWRDGASPGPLKVTGRLIGIPSGTSPVLNRLLVTAGTLPNPGEVLAEQHFARFHRLTVGSTVRIDMPGEKGRPLRVSGVGISPEYLWVSRDAQDPMPTPLEFGVFWMDRAQLAEVSRRFEARAIWLPVGMSLWAGGLAGGADVSRGNQVLVRTRAGTDLADVRRKVMAALGSGRSASAVERSDLPSIKLLQMDLDSFREMAWFFPLLFLGVGAFMSLASMGRMVDSQRIVIGTFLALGMPRGRLMRHYLGLSVLPALAGSTVGAVLGLLGSGALTQEYAAEFGIPSVKVHAHPDLLLWGLGLGLAMALLAAWVPVQRVAAMSPSEAMRPPAPAVGRTWGVGRRAPAKAVSLLEMAVRNVARRPLRSLLSALGVAAALLLVLVSGVVFDGTEAALKFQFDKSQRHDLRVDFYLPWTQADLARELRQIGVLREVETALVQPVVLEAPGKEYRTVLEGAPEGARLNRTLEFGGNSVLPGSGQVVLAREVARKLGVGVGHDVTIRRLPDGKRVTMPVGGLSDTAMGGGATVRLADAWKAFGHSGRVNSLRVTCAAADRWTARSALEHLPRVAVIQDRLAFRALVGQMMAFGYALIGAMLLFSAVLAAAILFNTVTLSILERSRELATLRALGMSASECAYLLAAEHGLIALGGLAIGLPFGLWGGASALGLYQSELFSLPFAVTGRTLALAVFGTLLVLTFALVPGVRRLARMDLAAAIRERTG